MDEHSLDGKRAVVASKFLPLLICVSQTIILSMRSLSNKTCLSIASGALLFLFAALRSGSVTFRFSKIMCSVFV